MQFVPTRLATVCLAVCVFALPAAASAAPKVPPGTAAPDPARFPDVSPHDGQGVRIQADRPASNGGGGVTTNGAVLQRYRVEMTGGGYEPIRDNYQRFAIGNAFDPSGASGDGETFDVSYKPQSTDSPPYGGHPCGPCYYAGFMYGASGGNLGFPGAKGYQDCGWIASQPLSAAGGIPISHGCPTTDSPVHGGNGLITFLPDHSYKYLDNGNCYPLDGCGSGSPVTTKCDATAYSNVWPMRDGGTAPANGSVALDGVWVVPSGTTVGWRYVTRNKLWAMVNVTPPAGHPNWPHWVFLYFPCVQPY